MFIKYIFGTYDASKKLFDSHFLCEGRLVRVVAKCVVCFPPQCYFLSLHRFHRFLLFFFAFPSSFLYSPISFFSHMESQMPKKNDQGQIKDM